MTGAFFRLHRDLPREGPGDRAEIDWALGLAGIARDAQILDAACGPGADIAGLLEHAPEGHVTAVDMTDHFVAQVRAAYHGDARVTARVGDMATPGGPFDLIWCAGALYFLGVEAGLQGWRASLAEGGCVAFSEPVYFVDTPSQGARAFWEGHRAMTAPGICAAVEAAGYAVLGTKPVSDAAWEAYYRPLDARVAALRPGADADLEKVLDEAEREATLWRRHRDEVGYLMVVARPA